QQKVIDFLLRRGFVETRRVWDLRLDLTTMDLDAFLSISEEIAFKDITITTFDDERRQYQDAAYNKLHEFLNSVKQDDPERQPFIPAPIESVVHWFGRPY